MGATARSVDRLAAAEPGQTLIHGDFKMANLLFRADGGECYLEVRGARVAVTAASDAGRPAGGAASAGDGFATDRAGRAALRALLLREAAWQAAAAAQRRKAAAAVDE